MDLKNKKGFITVYVMLAMMFFVAFVVTASVTASRKLKLQKEANTALVEIYSQNIDGIERNDTTIPIYTQAQFLRIANWINTENTSKTTEYIYINNVVYTLDAQRYNGTDEYKAKNPPHEFILKTDLWFKGTVNDGADKEDYPYIPLNEDSTNVHEALKEFKRIADYKSGHTIYLKLDTETYRYDDVIRVTNADEFLKIGTANPEDSDLNTIGGYPAYANETYLIESTIDLSGKCENIDWSIRPEFSGTIKGNGHIINGLKIDLTNSNVDNTTNVGLFKSNAGTIKNLTFTDVEVTCSSSKSITSFGIIAGNNSGTISNCNIILSNQKSSDAMMNINGEGKLSVGNFGTIAGNNSGNISTCEIQAVEVKRSYCSKFRSDNWI
ncbi:MAG: hypothetical protein ACI4UE_05050 [Candidatus Scatovivens sp.]